MKILYIGHYKEGTGWSKAALDTIMALDSSGLDVVCRNIKLTNSDSKISPQILSLESKDLQNVDYCIQNVLPHHMIGTKKFKKNIGYFVAESNTTKHSGWIDHLSLMDEVWVPNNQLKISLHNDGIANDKIKVVPYAFDTMKYTRKYYDINFGKANHTFKFYYIGEINDRKNLTSIIRCFHSEFENYEPVSLVLKVKRNGISQKDLNNYVVNICKSVKEELRMYPSTNDYHSEIIISGELSDEQIQSLHHTCDCFVGPTHGEGWSIPAFDAMAHGKTPVCSNEGGPKDFITDDTNTGILIGGNIDICNHGDPAFPELFTGRENWFTPSEQEIKRAMRFYYENRSNIDRSSGLKRAEDFSYVNVGKLIRDALND
jgi:glycosyltransferase involved in cell wall biosynthesis